jgi:hypothetical protein
MTLSMDDDNGVAAARDDDNDIKVPRERDNGSADGAVEHNDVS